MKKFLSILILVGLLLLPTITIANLQEEPGAMGIQDAITKATKYLTGIVFVLAVLFLIYGAFLFVTAAGNEEQVGKARKIILYALIGVAIALLAQGAVAFIKEIFWKKPDAALRIINV